MDWSQVAAATLAAAALAAAALAAAALAAAALAAPALAAAALANRETPRRMNAPQGLPGVCLIGSGAGPSRQKKNLAPFRGRQNRGPRKNNPRRISTATDRKSIDR